MATASTADPAFYMPCAVYARLLGELATLPVHRSPDHNFDSETWAVELPSLRHLARLLPADTLAGQNAASRRLILSNMRVLAIDQMIDSANGSIGGRTATLELGPEEAKAVPALRRPERPRTSSHLSVTCLINAGFVPYWEYRVLNGDEG